MRFRTFHNRFLFPGWDTLPIWYPVKIWTWRHPFTVYLNWGRHMFAIGLP
jgi:hypothetical protein